MVTNNPARPNNDPRPLDDSELEPATGGWKIPNPSQKKKLTCPWCRIHLTIPVHVMTCPFCHKTLKKH